MAKTWLGSTFVETVWMVLWVVQERVQEPPPSRLRCCCLLNKTQLTNKVRFVKMWTIFLVNIISPLPGDVLPLSPDRETSTMSPFSLHFNEPFSSPAANRLWHSFS